MAGIQSLPGTQEDQEQFLRNRGASNFIEAVVHCLRESEDKRVPLATTLRAFYREPDVLYVALDYALHMGVQVRFVNTGDPATRAENDSQAA